MSPGHFVCIYALLSLWGGYSLDALSADGAHRSLPWMRRMMKPTWLKRVLPMCFGVALVGSSLHAGAQVAPAAQTQEQTDRQERRFQKEVEGLLVAENFDDLDRMADGFRREKTRMPGGGWRLREFYGLLDGPQLTDKDTIDHLAHLAAWMAKRPESITARVAMATSMTRWAWVARGNGYANTVSPEGMRLFTGRAQVAQRILQESQDLKQKCPQWYSEMMTVGLALNWSDGQVKENFERGIQFEPEYFYLYKEYANYLLPKWDGQPGDAARFAKKAADKLGGSEGDLLYFQLAENLIKRGSRNENSPNGNVKDVDWPRIQRGYQAIVSRYGTTGKVVNQLAFFAYIYRDRPVAQAQFAVVGDGWNKGIWKDRSFFDRARDWAGGRAGTTD